LIGYASVRPISTSAHPAQCLIGRLRRRRDYGAAFGRGAVMDDDEVVDYALREFRRLAGLCAQSDAQAPDLREATRTDGVDTSCAGIGAKPGRGPRDTL